MNENKEKITFESAISRLEEIVRALESGSAPLDDSLALFEEGVSLVKFCNSTLDAVQEKRTLISDGKEIPFGEDVK